MASRLSEELNTASKGRTTDMPAFDAPSSTYKYYLVQETDRPAPTPARATVNAKGFENKVEIPDDCGVLQSAFVRWHQLKGELSASAFQEISEKVFNEIVEAQFAEIHGDKVLKFSEPSISL